MIDTSNFVRSPQPGSVVHYVSPDGDCISCTVMRAEGPFVNLMPVSYERIGAGEIVGVRHDRGERTMFSWHYPSVKCQQGEIA